MNELFCTNCGSRLEPGSVFCDNCGTPVEGATPQFSAAPPMQGMPTYSNGPTVTQSAKKSRKWPIIIAILIVVIIVAIIAIAFAMQESDSSGNGNSAAVRTQEKNSSAAGSSSSASSTSTPVFTMVETSSVLAPDSTTSDYSGRNAHDGIMETAWNEGAYGDGTGEWIEFSASTPQRVSTVSIMGGYPKPYRDGSDVYYKNNRPRQVTISYDGGSQTFMLQDLRGQYQNCNLTQPVETTFIRITINSVYKGTSFDDCCIAEVTVS